MENQSDQNLSIDPVRSVDLNCDVGESTGQQIVGNDAVLIPLVSSANIACGAHAGDETHITNAVKIAIHHGVTIGAHPGYPDRENFGRQAMDLSAEQLGDTLREQLEFLNAIVLRHGGEIKYVKPHGALYHRCNIDAATAETVVEVSRSFGRSSGSSFSRSLSMMGQAGTEFQGVCDSLNVRFIREAFADRRYLESGNLSPRSQIGGVIEDPDEAASQAVAIVFQEKLTTVSNHEVGVIGDSICVHGDSPNACEILMKSRGMLMQAGVLIQSCE